MNVTVLWEDERGAQIIGFGPHELLLSSMADDLTSDQVEHRRHRALMSKKVSGQPKKGNGNILSTLKDDLTRYRGPVIAVMDRDKAHRLWRDAQPQPTNCMQGISAQFRKVAPGTYDLIFLLNHTEDLLDAALVALSRPRLTTKPPPNERDRILNTASWGSREVRMAIRRASPSFDRIVKVVGSHYRR